MSEDSKIFLREAHLLINETVEYAMHVLRGSEFTDNDRLGGILDEKDIGILRNIRFTSEQIETIKLLLKAVGQMSVTGVLGEIDGIIMSSSYDLPNLSLINRATGADIADESLLNEEFIYLSEGN